MPKNSPEQIIDRPHDASLRRGGTSSTSSGGGATTFLGLTDTPSTYTGADGYFVVVDEATGALIFQAGGTVVSVNGQTGVVVLDSDDIAEGVTNLYLTQERVEDYLGASATGGTQTGIAVTYTDLTGVLNFDAQTAGDARYGRLATANTWTQNQSIASTQTTGNALRVIRDLAAASTAAPVVDLIQDNASDDQAVLRIQQDAAAAIVNIYDTTDLVIQVADGGRLLLTPTATSGAALSVVRDLASASTDWPVVDFIQDNTGDDQTVLQVRQDGTGDIAAFKDGANTVLQILDGGRFVFNQVGTSGVGFSFNRNLAAASTDSAVFEVVQDNSGDDQAAVRIQQDGTGHILDLYDGVSLVFSVADGGAVNATGAVDFDSTLNVDGVATFNGTVMFSPGGTQDYELSNSTTALVLQSKSAGTSSNLWLMANDGDATDTVAFRLWGKGTPASLTNIERLTIYWNTATSSYEILSEADGTGTQRPLIIYTEGNTNQVNLATTGRVGFGVAPTLATAEISQTQTTGNALRVVRDLASASTDSPVTSIVQDNTGDDQSVLRVQQDGTGNILDLYDGATLVVQVVDGGKMAVGSAIATPSGVLHAGAATLADSVLLERTGQTTDSFFASQRLLVTKTTNMADGFGPGLAFAIQDDAAVINYIGVIGAIRGGADNTGDIVLAPVVAGVTAVKVTVKSDGKVGFSTTSPQGLIHGHDGTGGFLHVSKTGIVGSTVVLVPDGTGDVTKGVRIMGVASNSTPTTLDVAIYIANGGTSDITDGGGNTLRFAVAANGQLSVVRQAGTATWECTVWCVWK